jgi:hypothetical protein
MQSPLRNPALRPPSEISPATRDRSPRSDPCLLRHTFVDSRGFTQLPMARPNEPVACPWTMAFCSFACFMRSCNVSSSGLAAPAAPGCARERLPLGASTTNCGRSPASLSPYSDSFLNVYRRPRLFSSLLLSSPRRSRPFSGFWLIPNPLSLSIPCRGQGWGRHESLCN